jgi:hypothetical protein
MFRRLVRGRRAWLSRRFFADGAAGAGGGTPPGTPPAPPAALVNPDGTYAGDWLQHPAVPEDLRGNAQLATHKSFGDTLKNWATLEKIRGHTVVPIPAENSDEATWGLVWDRLGRPKEPGGYALPDATAAGIPKEQQAAPEFIQGVMADAHAAGLTNRQFTKLLEGWNRRIAGVLKTQATARANAETAALGALQTEWPGPAFAANQALVAQFLRATAPAETVQAFEQLGLLKNPAFLRWAHRQAVQSREAEPNLEVTVTTDQAAAAETEIARIENEVGGPLYDDHHPQHGATLKRYKELKAVVARVKHPGA